MRRARYAFGCVYVAIPAALAVMGNRHEYAGWYFAALAVTLPCGVAGFIGIYGGYAVIKGVGGMFLSTTTSTGDDAVWLSTALDVVRVGAFVAAGVANALLFELWLRRRAARPSSLAANAPPLPDSDQTTGSAALSATALSCRR
jgi:hypothetical protein